MREETWTRKGGNAQVLGSVVQITENANWLGLRAQGKDDTKVRPFLQ